MGKYLPKGEKYEQKKIVISGCLILLGIICCMLIFLSQMPKANLAIKSKLKFDSEDVCKISIRYRHEISTYEEIDIINKVIKLLIDFNYKEKLVISSGFAGGDDCYLTVVETNGKEHTYMVAPPGIRIGNVWYTGDEMYFYEIFELLKYEK